MHGSFVLKLWLLDADIKRVKELAEKWTLNYDDSFVMLKQMEPTELMKKGMKRFIEEILCMSEESYWDKVKAFKEE